MIDAIRFFIDRESAYLFSAKMLRDDGLIVVAILVTILIEIAARRPVRRRFGSKSTLIDAAYWFIYYGGPYQLLWVPIFLFLSAGINRFAPWTQVRVINHLSMPLRIGVFIVAADLLGYWIHRWMHTNQTLWAFHKVHHSQTQLTVLTNYRRHAADELVQRLISFFVFLFLGSTVMTWAVVDITGNAILLLQHSGLNWTYGFGERLFISPRMHGIHHSIASEHQNRNFGMLFSVWDRVFGTSLAEGTAQAYGLETPMPESLWRHLVDPFREVLGSPADALPPETVDSSSVA